MGAVQEVRRYPSACDTEIFSRTAHDLNNGHAAWARQIAEEQQVRFIDLHELIAQRYDAMGPEAVDALFADRGVHTSHAGAILNAHCVLDGLNNFPDSPLRPFMLVDETPEGAGEPNAAN